MNRLVLRWVVFSVSVLMGLSGSVLTTVGEAAAADPPEYLGSFGPDGSEATEFERAGAVAVDQQTLAVYVADRNKGSLFKFDAEGNPVAFEGLAPDINGNELSGLAFIKAGGDGKNQVAVDSSSHVIYVTDKEGTALSAFGADGEPANFTAGPAAGSSEISGFTELAGVAVDSSGNIYASDRIGVIRVYASSGEPITEFAATEPANLAVDASGSIYVVRLSESVLKFTPSEVPVTSTTTFEASAPPINSTEPVTVGVDQATNDVYVAQGISDPKVVRYDQSGTVLNEFAGLSEEGELWAAGGIGIGGPSGQVYLSNNRFSGLQQVEIFAPKEIVVDRPSVVSTSALTVTADSATLRSVINPNTFGTSYHFEYGPENCEVGLCARLPVDDAAISAGHEEVAVTQEVTRLLPNTTYHFRVVAENAEGVTEGPDRTFTTQSSDLSFLLADHRAWEMVSPPDKGAGRLVGSTWGLVQAAASGGGIAYLSKGPLEAEPSGARLPEASTVLARRSADGWISRDLSPPNMNVAPVSNGDLGAYKLFDPELARAILSPRSSTLLSSEASDRTPYLRQNSEPAIYTPLVTSKEGYANVPAGTQFGGKDTEAVGAVALVGASGDLSRVALQSAVPLSEGAGANALYEWSEGQLQPVSVLPVSESGGVVQGSIGGASTRNAVSEDGMRVFWTASSSNGLYLRDVRSGETGRLDIGLPGGIGAVQPRFQGASADGRVVFFTDEQQLTKNASPEGSDLYRCEIPAGASPVCGTLTDLSAPPEGSGKSGMVQGLVGGIGEDGASVYFVARGALSSGSNEAGENAVSDRPNLYRWSEGTGVQFLATLSDEDFHDWAPVGGTSGDFGLSTSVSPSGQYFAFASAKSLTGYDNHDADTGEAVQEAFLYDAASGGIDCISCNPTGARPRGSTFAFGGRRLVDPRESWVDQRVAAILPEASVATVTGPSLYRPRGVLDNGRVFFNAIDSLVPADSNGQWDVYEYESHGIGDCSSLPEGGAVSSLRRSCVSLISSGAAEEEAAFMDASSNGDDVFFLTPGRLSGTDGDEDYDLYDARVGGTRAGGQPPSECQGEACQVPSSVAGDPPASSATFDGAGNVKAKPRKHCPKGKRKVRHKGKAHCVSRRHRWQANHQDGHR